VSVIGHGKSATKVGVSVVFPKLMIASGTPKHNEILRQLLIIECAFAGCSLIWPGTLLEHATILLTASSCVRPSQRKLRPDVQWQRRQLPVLRRDTCSTRSDGLASTFASNEMRTRLPTDSAWLC
jgi:hypothetical protein